ncbi:MAG: 2,3-bisphosphoglycerate-independent phosphoglycerate mutase [Candidatus Sericytochromatia bacterium]|nr:2,3-bisphosphoglycerate-independent phosphoglycerate mutase [Candidatus Sericytochromatia bacterium]
MSEPLPRPVVLTILDGWGISDVTAGNAIALANRPVSTAMMARYPWTRIETSGEAVGLPPGQMGNSEVGHLNIGAGRIVTQELTRIDKSVRDGDFFENPVLLAAVKAAQAPGQALHLQGLTSHGGVHSSLEHLYACLELAKRQGVSTVYLHAFTDGRDASPRSGQALIANIEARMAAIGIGQVATVVGRYYAMDRDNRWERIQLAYEAIVDGIGELNPHAVTAIGERYAAGETDEFLKPIIVVPAGRIRNGDGVIVFNFRPDRAVELTQAIAADPFDGFPRQPLHVTFACMTLYQKSLHLPVAFELQSLAHILPELVAAKGWRQFRTAETEKFRHVTSFFNGSVLEPFPGEDRELIPSPKVATYDLQPEMSADAVCAAAINAIRSGHYALVVINFANPDMVGHTGVLPAGIAAIEAVDACLGRLDAACQAAGAALFITADHGNAEQMDDPVTGEAFAAHTTNPVPFIAAYPGAVPLRSGGILADIAPTILAFWGLPQPAEMTGASLFALAPPVPVDSRPAHAQR